MMDAVIAAGERLAEALLAENEALAALDLTRAAATARSCPACWCSSTGSCALRPRAGVADR